MKTLYSAIDLSGQSQQMEAQVNMLKFEIKKLGREMYAQTWCLISPLEVDGKSNMELWISAVENVLLLIVS